MVVLGVDPHKKTHTVVAADQTGRQLATITVQATTAGHLKVLRWAARYPQRRWALEDGRHVCGRLLRDLIAGGEQVTCVPAKLMAGARAGARTRGKSDPIDALAVARAALREPDLPAAHLDQQCLDLRLLVDHREHLVAERTRNINRLRWDLVDLDPDLEPTGQKMTTQKVLRELIDHLELLAVSVRRELAIEKARRILADTIRINELERDITRTITPLAPTLLALFGVAALTAAKLMGEVAGIERFPTPAKLANHAGTACIPVWSGNSEKHRLNRGANRQLNCAVHRIAITQVRHHPPAQALFARRRATGDTKAGAYRVVKRHLIDVIYRAMRTDAQRPSAASPVSHASAA
ncbi:MAG: transposase family protein [Nocardioides sp.]|nr:transposase family protein [Nocardioides sp.]